MECDCKMFLRSPEAMKLSNQAVFWRHWQQPWCLGWVNSAKPSWKSAFSSQLCVDAMFIEIIVQKPLIGYNFFAEQKSLLERTTKGSDLWSQTMHSLTPKRDCFAEKPHPPSILGPKSDQKGAAYTRVFMVFVTMTWNYSISMIIYFKMWSFWCPLFRYRVLLSSLL